MMEEKYRFYAPWGNITPTGPSTWQFVDMSQRRFISVTMDEELDSEDPAVEHLKKYIDILEPNVYALHVTSSGDLISSSTDPVDDETRCPFYAHLDTVQLPEGVDVISRLDLQEVDRLMGNVDLVICPQSSEPGRRLVFKYYFLEQHFSFVWNELSIWIRLPKHPNIVPFDRVVVDELEGRVIGFTSVFIPGGTFEENKSRTFKLKWLHQLIEVVDELNLSLGVSHQDIAPRNILLNEATDSLQLFDFNHSTRLRGPCYVEGRNDLKGTIFTMYEIITRNDIRRSMRLEEQEVSAIEQEDWVKHPDVLLDHPVSKFRQVLKEWCEKRRNGRQILLYTEAPNFLDWPPFPQPPLVKVEPFWRGDKLEEYNRLYDQKRTELQKQGKAILHWQRPPQKREE